MFDKAALGKEGATKRGKKMPEKMVIYIAEIS
jgi:hypothetical protein